MKPLDPELKPWAAYGPISHDARSPAPDGELFPAPLGAGREVRHVADRHRHVEIEVDVVLRVDAGIERNGRVVAERGVDRVADELVDLCAADVHAGVPVEAAAREPAQAGDERVVGHVAAELRRETSGEPAVEREAVRVGLHRREGARVRDVVDDRYRGAAAGARDAGVGPDPVADEQARRAVVESRAAEDAAAGMRIPGSRSRRSPCGSRSWCGRRTAGRCRTGCRSCRTAFRSSSISGEPQTCAGFRMLPLPASMMPAASLRWMLRLVGLALPYSRLRFTNPFGPSGSPVLPDTEYACPRPPIPLHECLMSPMMPARSSMCRRDWRRGRRPCGTPGCRPRGRP